MDITGGNGARAALLIFSVILAIVFALGFIAGFFTHVIFS